MEKISIEPVWFIPLILISTLILLIYIIRVLGFSIFQPRSMEKKVDKEFTWVIKNFSSLQSEKIYSDKFVLGGCKWHLSAYPKGNKVNNYPSMYLEVADYGSLPSGWRRHVRYRLSAVNQRFEELSPKFEVERWFDEKAYGWGFPFGVSHTGFAVNEVKIAVEIDLLEIVGKVDVKGFHVLSSQVEYVSRMLEKHPETAFQVYTKNPNIRGGYMSLLLTLIESLRQSPHELSEDDLDDAHNTLKSLTGAGFKLEWLEKKLDQVSEMREKEIDGEIRRQVIENELKDLKHKCSNLEAKLEKEKSEALAAKNINPISFDDIIQCS